MKGLLGIIGSNRLHETPEVDRERFLSLFEDMIVMRFETKADAERFASNFVLNYLFPTYRCNFERAIKFSIQISMPTLSIYNLEKWAEQISEIAKSIDGISHNPLEEAWIVVPNSEYRKVQEYLESLPR